MPFTVERYSTSAGHRFLRRVLTPLLLLLLLTFVFYLLINQFLLSTFRVESGSMLPTLYEGDRVLASPLSYGPRVPFFPSRLPGFRTPRRGDVVVLVPPYATPVHPVLSLFDPLFRFFTLQKLSLVDGSGGNLTVRSRYPYLIKRIIGVPGDTIRLTGFVAEIRPSGRDQFYNEEELVRSDYRPIVKGLPEGWKPEFPLAGNTEEVTLGEEEYLVLGDNRLDSSDSRSWGPVPRSLIVGRVLLRYWPLSQGKGF